MSNKLLGDWRLRVSNSNNANFSVATRLHFFDANTMSDKEVFADINSLVSLGAYVDLDSSGYVPVSGVWLTTGAYSCRVETYSYTDDFNVDIYDSVWTIPYIAGADENDGSDSMTVFDTVSDMRAFTPDGTNAMCLGYYDVGDMLAGGASFKWYADSLATDDEGSIIKPTSFSVTDEGRWIRIFEIEPTIRDFGATPGQTNVKIRILNALTYAASNNSLTIFPHGEYELVAEDLILDETCVIKEGCLFNTTGEVLINKSIIETNKPFVSDVSKLSVNLRRIKPEWFVTDDDTDNTTSIKLAYINAVAYNSAVYLTSASGYAIATGDTINENGAAGTTIASGSYLTITSLGLAFCLGNLSFEDWNGEDAIRITDATLLIPFGKMYDRWFQSISQFIYTSLMNSRTYNVTFVWTSKFVWDSEYEEISTVKHLFEDNASWQLTADCQFYISEFDYKYLFDVASLEYLVNINSVINTSSDAIPMDANFSVPAVSNLAFNNCVFDVSISQDLTNVNDLLFNKSTFSVTGSCSITFSYGTFTNCIIESGTAFRLNSTANLQMNNCRATMLFKLSGVGINANNNIFNALELHGSSTVAEFEDMNIRNNNFRDTVTLASNFANTIITGVNVIDNDFSLNLSTTRILKTGSFSNVAGVHKFCIKNNIAPSKAEQTYIPMTEGRYLWRQNESGIYILATPTITLFNISLSLTDDTKYNGLTIFKRQIFALNDLTDANKFDTFNLINAKGDFYDTGVVTITNDYYFQSKETFVGDILTNEAFNVNRLPVVSTGSIVTNWLSGIIEFSLYNSTLHDDKLTPFLP